MIAARRDGPFLSIYDFCERVDLTAMNRRVVESLIRAGALDGLHGTRSQLFGAIDSAMETGQRAQRDKASGHSSRTRAAEPSRLDGCRETRGRKGNARVLCHRPSAGSVDG
jgi:DNA polymerase III alpha subunit